MMARIAMMRALDVDGPKASRAAQRKRGKKYRVIAS
jgi:hypothetical protein